MGRHLLLATICILILGLGVAGVLLYRYANVGIFETAVSPSPEPSAAVVASVSLSQNGYVGELAKLEQPSFMLPVNEIYIKYSRAIAPKASTSAYLLAIDKNDTYSMFCVNQILSQSGVEFSIIKDRQKSKIYLNTTDVGLLERVIKDLKSYEINSKVTEVRL